MKVFLLFALLCGKVCMGMTADLTKIKKPSFKYPKVVGILDNIVVLRLNNKSYFVTVGSRVPGGSNTAISAIERMSSGRLQVILSNGRVLEQYVPKSLPPLDLSTPKSSLESKDSVKKQEVQPQLIKKQPKEQQKNRDVIMLEKLLKTPQ